MTRFSSLLLLEAAQDYEAMFKDILANNKAGRSFSHGSLEEEIKAHIAWAKNTFKKRDRVVWWLRYLKALKLGETIEGSDADRKTAVEGFIRRWDPTASITAVQTIISQAGKDQFEHWFSLDYVKIQDYVFGTKTYSEIRNDLRELEREYVERANAKIKHDDSSLEGTSILMDCGDNWFWVSLNRAACSSEGKAMGHCGNSPRSMSDENILSLRKFKEKSDGNSYWEPHLTFTINEGGELLEMKGRGNKKPAEQYHPMIVKLLTHRDSSGDYLVSDLVGGEWLPDNDFSINDLTESSKTKLLTIRPELGDLFDYVRYGGDVFNHHLVHLLRRYCRRHPFISRKIPQWYDWESKGGEIYYRANVTSYGDLGAILSGNWRNNLSAFDLLGSDPLGAFSFLMSATETADFYAKAEGKEQEIEAFQSKWREYAIKEARAIIEDLLGPASAFCKIRWDKQTNSRMSGNVIPIEITDPKAFVIALEDRISEPMKSFMTVLAAMHTGTGSVYLRKLRDEVSTKIDREFSKIIRG